MRVVRCPNCLSLFDVKRYPPGTIVRCSNCKTILRLEFHRQSKGIYGLLLTISGLVIVILSVILFHLLTEKEDANQKDSVVAPIKPIIIRLNPKRQDEPLGFPFYRNEWERSMLKKIRWLKNEFGLTTFMFGDSYPFIIAVEKGALFDSDVIACQYARILNKLYETFIKKFSKALHLGPIKEALPVIVFNSQQSYDSYCLKTRNIRLSERMSGFYEMSKGRVIMYHDFYLNNERLCHEATHELVDYYSKVYSKAKNKVHSFWFWEGIAIYFEACEKKDDGNIVITGGINYDRLQDVKRALTDPNLRDYVSISRLVNMSIKEFWNWYSQSANSIMRDKKTGIYYATSWALVHFLINNYKDLFHAYFKNELIGGGESFERILRKYTGRDLKDIQYEFEDYIKSLR